MRIRPRLSYANVAGTLALVVAMSGTAVAATQISGSTIKDRSIPGKKLILNTVTGREVKESTLAKVPNADKLDGLDSTALVRGAHVLVQRKTVQLPGVSVLTPYTRLITIAGLGRLEGLCYDETNGANFSLQFVNTTAFTEHVTAFISQQANTSGGVQQGGPVPSSGTFSWNVLPGGSDEPFSGNATVLAGGATKSATVVFGGLTHVDNGTNCQVALTVTSD